MGCAQSTTTTTNDTKMMPAEQETAPTYNGPVEEYKLKKLHGGCTGMFWRADPTGKTKLASNQNWPHDGAKLRGHVVVVKGKKWLLATQVQQKGSTAWKPAPVGATMPFEYNRHYYLG
jgi:hypothetical protein